LKDDEAIRILAIVDCFTSLAIAELGKLERVLAPSRKISPSLHIFSGEGAHRGIGSAY